MAGQEGSEVKAGPVAERTPLSQEQVEAIIGSLLLALSIYQFVRSMVRVARAGQSSQNPFLATAFLEDSSQLSGRVERLLSEPLAPEPVRKFSWLKLGGLGLIERILYARRALRTPLLTVLTYHRVATDDQLGELDPGTLDANPTAFEARFDRIWRRAIGALQRWRAGRRVTFEQEAA